MLNSVLIQKWVVLPAYLKSGEEGGGGQLPPFPLLLLPHNISNIIFKSNFTT